MSRICKLIYKTICNRIAWLLPSQVIYFAVIRAWSFGTVGKYSSTIAPDITADEVVERWSLDHNL